MKPSDRENTTPFAPPEGLPEVGPPLPDTAEAGQNEGNYLGASNAHMSPYRMAKMKELADSRYAHETGILPDVEETRFPEAVEIAEDKRQTTTDLAIPEVPDHLKAKKKWVPPSRSS